MESYSTFYSNNTQQTFLAKLQDSLRKCTAFYFSVSFIKTAGLVLVQNDIENALKRGAAGRLITSSYQNFTDIGSLQWFYRMSRKYPQFQCHFDLDCFHDNAYNTVGFHTKGYLFEYPDAKEVLIGSSNITRFALLKNKEWDLAVNGFDNPAYIQTMTEFNALWDSTFPLSEDIIRQYTMELDYAVTRWDMDYEMVSGTIRPNYMQRKALRELMRYRAQGVRKALVIAAAGSGKTYLAAFDALNMAPRRLLYIVQEGTILAKACETFQKVFGPDKDYGLYDKDHKEMYADFLFSTNITMARAVDREEFDPQTFDYIVVDECHHATASSYTKIINYFKPEFLLGLTATPERRDNENVFALFDENVPYELRLRDAIINGLVVPFHYFGIRDQMATYDLNTNQERLFIRQMIDPDHVDFIHQEIERHRIEGTKLKALAFCRNVQHARAMAEALGAYYETAYLTGRNTAGERIKAFQDLQNEQSPLEILCTVDILNEGVDIPSVNMVLFLRPTESSTIFIQQLGRGLRKYPGKNYVTVLDFIGNSYKRSVQIAFALGSLSQNFVVEKRLLKELVMTDYASLDLAKYGVEIHIDHLSREEILHYIQNENFNSRTYVTQDYKNFKSYIRAPYYPSHMDYLNNDAAPDLVRFMQIKLNGRKTGSYYGFLKAINEDNLPLFNEDETQFIQDISSLLPLVRPYEYLIYTCLFAHSGSVDETALRQYVQQETGTDYRENIFQHALRFIGSSYIVHKDGDITIDERIRLTSSLTDYVQDLLAYGLGRYETDFPQHNTGFKPWSEYTTDQIQRVRLVNPSYNQLGTYYDPANKAVYALVTLHKTDITDDTRQLDYDDQYLSANVFQWESRNNLPDNEREYLIHSQTVYLFIRKVKESNGVTLPYIFAGTGRFTGWRSSPTKDKCLIFTIQMDQVPPDDIAADFGVPTE